VGYAPTAEIGIRELVAGEAMLRKTFSIWIGERAREDICWMDAVEVMGPTLRREREGWCTLGFRGANRTGGPSTAVVRHGGRTFVRDDNSLRSIHYLTQAKGKLERNLILEGGEWVVHGQRRMGWLEART
jgi:hypothetical protein